MHQRLVTGLPKTRWERERAAYYSNMSLLLWLLLLLYRGETATAMHSSALWEGTQANAHRWFNGFLRILNIRSGRYMLSGKKCCSCRCPDFRPDRVGWCGLLRGRPKEIMPERFCRHVFGPKFSNRNVLGLGPAIIYDDKYILCTTDGIHIPRRCHCHLTETIPWLK